MTVPYHTAGTPGTGLCGTANSAARRLFRVKNVAFGHPPEVRLAPDGDLPDGCRPGFELKNNAYIPVDTEAFETSTLDIFAIGDINWYPRQAQADPVRIP
jgi:hypothetical protein